MTFSDGPVAELAMIIASPRVKVAVRGDCKNVPPSSADLAEAYSSGSGRGQGDFRAAGDRPLHRAHAPGIRLGPMSGELQISGNGLVEIVGDGC